MVDNLLSRIEELKRRKGAVILAHYYTLPEVQAVADFLGDSLALSIEAQKVEARTILFAGVHFMAETAKVLCPDKKVLIPVPEASCSLADGCEAEAFRRFRARYPGHTVVSYVNTSVEIKAPPDDDTCGCNNCVYMKMVTLERIAACLENESPEVVIDEQVRRAAERSIRRMIEIG